MFTLYKGIRFNRIIFLFPYCREVDYNDVCNSGYLYLLKFIMSLYSLNEFWILLIVGKY